jgi:hypothetical protein
MPGTPRSSSVNDAASAADIEGWGRRLEVEPPGELVDGARWMSRPAKIPIRSHVA